MGDPRKTPSRLPLSQRFLALDRGHSENRILPQAKKFNTKIGEINFDIMNRAK